MAHLSYLVNTLIERRYLITFSADNAVYQFDLSREDDDPNYKVFHFGSVVEEMVTNILGCGEKQPTFPQIPKMINYTVKRQPVSFGSNADNVSDDTVYLTDSTETRPGYVRLKFRLGEMDNLPEHLRSQISKYYLHPESSGKCFVGIRCSIWPNEAREWFERDRPVEWPGEHILQLAKEDDCFLLSRHHPQSDFPESEWQWIFPITERRLALEALSEDQKYCFRVFKLLVDFHTRNLPVKLSTTHLKTIMYTTCEIIAFDLWKLNPGGCLLFLLQRLITCLRMGVISNYFIAANNMINHFTTKQLCALRQRLYAVRVFPVPALVMLVDSHNLFGTCFLDRTLADIERFRKHRDLYRSFFECFLVNFSLCYRAHVLSMYFENAKQILEEAYFVKTEKLATNQSEELDFEQFLLDVTGDEFGDLKGLVVYEIDMVCNSSFSHSLRNSTDFVAFKDILESTDCMEYSEVPVPRDVLDSRYKVLMFLETLTSHLTHQRQYQKAAHFVRCAIKKSMEAIQCSNEEREELQTASNHENLFHTQMTLYNCVLLRLYNDLYNIYKSMGQTELMQEYIADYEVVCLASDYTYHYNRVAKIWQKLGNNARAQELRDQAESIKSSKTSYSSNVSRYSSIDDVD
ncbi:uncharacterized protein [Argopecten irradians]|uniref:uncharacterized protein n=1 Tax=Argopecten irradians TaxID=31199 RepID=UPI0037223CC2